MPRYVEHTEQVALFNLAAKRGYSDGVVADYIFAVPTAGTIGGRRGRIAGARRKAEGVKAGIPDVECFVASRGFTGLHIEMKRHDGVPSDVTPDQKKMMARLEKEGRKCVVAFGVVDAWQNLCDYLKIDSRI